MTVFGDTAFKEVIRLNEIIRWDPNPIQVMCFRTRERDTKDAYGQRKSNVKTQAAAICKYPRKPTLLAP